MCKPSKYAGYFFSGSNHAGEILALAQLGLNIGVAADEVVKQQGQGNHAERMLHYVAMMRDDVHVFLDNGAFGEVSFAGGTRSIKKPITPEAWRKRLDMFHRVAAVFEGNCTVVAPDSVGDQRETLARLATYRDDVLDLRDAGARVIVPIQRGEWSMKEMDRRVCEVLGWSGFVRGIPLKKDATTVEELRAFADAHADAGTMPAFHLLGKGPDAADFDECAAAVAAAADVSCDSCKIRSLVGRTNGRGNGPRIVTKSRDAVLALQAAWGAEWSTIELKRRTVLLAFGSDDMAHDAVGLVGFEPFAPAARARNGRKWVGVWRMVKTGAPTIARISAPYTGAPIRKGTKTMDKLGKADTAKLVTLHGRLEEAVNAHNEALAEFEAFRGDVVDRLEACTAPTMATAHETWLGKWLEERGVELDDVDVDDYPVAAKVSI